MAETRIDKAQDRIVELEAIIRLMLTSTGEIKGRAIAEHLVGTYRPPIDTVCPVCHEKTIGPCVKDGCK